MKRNIIKMIAGLLAFVLLLSGLPTQIAHASAGEELLGVISYADGSYLEITLETLPQARASGSVTKAKTMSIKMKTILSSGRSLLLAPLPTPGQARPARPPAAMSQFTTASGLLLPSPQPKVETRHTVQPEW